MLFVKILVVGEVFFVFWLYWWVGFFFCFVSIIILDIILCRYSNSWGCFWLGFINFFRNFKLIRFFLNKYGGLGELLLGKFEIFFLNSM